LSEKKLNRAKKETTSGSIFKTFLKTKKGKILFITACVIFITSIPVAWWILEFMGLPLNESHVPGLGITETIEIPQRPGIQGVVIAGPIIEPLLFAIDLGVAPKALDWNYLQVTDPVADVKIRAQIINGGLEFDRKNGDINDAGHPRAGSIVESAMRTWGYKPYKEGEIRYWFHLGAEREKLIIDTSDLKPIKEYEKHPINDGILYHVEGIRRRDVKIERVKF
jgi:hypothetical protein